MIKWYSLLWKTTLPEWALKFRLVEEQSFKQQYAIAEKIIYLINMDN